MLLIFTVVFLLTIFLALLRLLHFDHFAAAQLVQPPPVHQHPRPELDAAVFLNGEEFLADADRVDVESERPGRRDYVVQGALAGVLLAPECELNGNGEVGLGLCVLRLLGVVVFVLLLRDAKHCRVEVVRQILVYFA